MPSHFSFSLEKRKITVISTPRARLDQLTNPTRLSYMNVQLKKSVVVIALSSVAGKVDGAGTLVRRIHN